MQTLPRRRRRTTLAVKFDRRWKLEWTSPEYICIFFRIRRQDIQNAGELWKDLVIKTILERENGIPVYNSLYVPENNI